MAFLGRRFSGAGTRGACVALVHADATELVAAKVSCKLVFKVFFEKNRKQHVQMLSVDW